MNRLSIIGMCMWVPIWILSYTKLAEKILNNPENAGIAVIVLVIMGAGVVLMFIGIGKDYLGKSVAKKNNTIK